MASNLEEQTTIGYLRIYTFRRKHFVGHFNRTIYVYCIRILLKVKFYIVLLINWHFFCILENHVLSKSLNEN